MASAMALVLARLRFCGGSCVGQAGLDGYEAKQGLLDR